jgi:hypothetical protein
MTYRCQVNADCWEKFFTREPDLAFLERYGPTEMSVDPNSVDSMVAMQTRIQNGEGPYYLSAGQIAKNALKDPLTVYKLKQG